MTRPGLCVLALATALPAPASAEVEAQIVERAGWAAGVGREPSLDVDHVEPYLWASFAERWFVEAESDELTLGAVLAERRGVELSVEATPFDEPRFCLLVGVDL